MSIDLRTLLHMPWRLKNEGRRVVAYPYIRAAFAYHGVAWGSGWRILGMPIIQRHHKSGILLSDRSILLVWRPALESQPASHGRMSCTCFRATAKPLYQTR